MATIYSFTYVDAKGKSTQRTLLAHVVPSTMYAGTDISELSEETMGLYSAEVDAAKDRFHRELEAINAKFDVNHRYRQFKPENMSNIQKENI